jgi:hypothetical protein
MSKVKNQHFVPQFYLRNFSINKSKINVYDKILKKSFISGIDSIACDKYFYDNDAFNEYFGVQIIEKTFGDFEGMVAPILDALLERLGSGKFAGFENTEKEMLSEFLYYQMIRTRESRTRQEQFHGMMKSELLERGFTMEQLKEYGFTENYDSKNEHLRRIVSPLDIQEMISEIQQRIWIPVKNVTKYLFYASDDPVVRHNHEERGHMGYELFIPLSPIYGLIVLVRQDFKDMEVNEDKVMNLYDKEYIKWYNHLQVSQCTRQVFSIDSNFKFVEKIISENPQVSIANRPRLESMYRGAKNY